MDSVFFALFATPNEFVERRILKKRYSPAFDHLCDDRSKELFLELRAVLLHIVASLRSSLQKQNVSLEFRKFLTAFSTCPVMERFSNFADCTQQEALEFLQFLFTCYGLNGDRSVGAQMTFEKRYGVFTRSKERVRWKDWFLRNDKKSSLIYVVPHDVFLKYRRLSSYLQYTQDTFDLEGATYKGCVINCSQERIRYSTFAELLVINLQRQDAVTDIVHHDPVSIAQTLTDAEGTTLYLDAIILHLGDTLHAGHYVCVKRCKNQWIFFDDLSHHLEFYASWSVLNKAHPNIRTHGVLFFYTKS